MTLVVKIPNETLLEALIEVESLFPDEAHWVKGTFHERRVIEGETIDCYCVMGGFRNVIPNKTFPTYIWGELEKLMVSQIPEGWGQGYDAKVPTLVSYNDDPSTTFADFQAWFQRSKDVLASH